MIEQENQTVENDSANESGTLLEGLRRVLMAGIGVAVLAQEEIEDFVTKLVERGEIAENDGRSLVSDILDRRRKEIQERSKQAGGGVDRRIEGMLSRLNVPTQSDINNLSEQISELSKKVDELRELDGEEDGEE
jgi:poly(hydroxyalkanoate) granule-associated protein